MPLAVTVHRTFCAAHRLRLGDGSEEPVHGHNWRVAVTVAREDAGVDAIGCVVDFHDLQSRLGALLRPWDTSDLNAHPPFADFEVNPTAEHVARVIAERLDLPAGVRVTRVEVSEAEDCVAVWSE
jgi:6-pyruvoyltetrahydropterin/6-carboxytetrahydropterin synthase